MHVDFADTPNAGRAKACWDTCEGYPTGGLREGLLAEMREALRCLRESACMHPCELDGQGRAAVQRADALLEEAQHIMPF